MGVSISNEAEQAAAEFLADFTAGAIEGAKSLASMSDEEMFRGLDQKTVDYLQARLTENPDLRTPLRKAARLRAARPRHEPRTSARYVYFIEARESGAIKIGSTSNPTARLSALQTGSPVRLRLIGYTEGGEPEERRLHRLFEDSRSHGEWFKPTIDLLDYITSLEDLYV